MSRARLDDMVHSVSSCECICFCFSNDKQRISRSLLLFIFFRLSVVKFFGRGDDATESGSGNDGWVTGGDLGGSLGANGQFLFSLFGLLFSSFFLFLLFCGGVVGCCCMLFSSLFSFSFGSDDVDDKNDDDDDDQRPGV